MKQKGLLFKVFIVLSSLVLTSCDLLNNLNFNGPRKRSSKEDESSEVADSQIINRTSNKGSSSSSKHVHSARENATWYIDDNYHWHECEANDGYPVDRGYHDFVYIERTEPTCTELGFYVRECTVCGYKKSEYIQVTGHSWEQIPIDQDPNYIAPTAQSNGVRTEQCSVCHVIQLVEIPKLKGTFEMGNVNLENDSSTGRVDLILYATQTNYSFDNFKIAFGLRDENNSFIYGSKNPSDSDYIYEPIYSDPATGLFYSVIHLTDLAEAGILSAGSFGIYAGPIGAYDLAYVNSISGDVRYDSYFAYKISSAFEHTNGQMYVKLDCETMDCHFHLSDAAIDYRNNDTEVWLTVFGESFIKTSSASALQATLDALNPRVDFIQIGGSWQTTVLENSDYYYEVKVENGSYMVYFNVNISFMLNSSATDYVTHINFIEPQQKDCKMETSFEHSYPMPNSDKTFQVISRIDSTNQEGYWGVLGIKII